jgi:hypothetical protein
VTLMQQFNREYQLANGNGVVVSMLNESKGSTKAFSYHSLIIDGITCVSIEFNYGVPNDSSIKRAERVIESYQNSNGAYCCIFDDGITGQATELTSNIILHMKPIEVMGYGHGSRKHISIEGSYEDKLVKFAVFDKGLIENAVLSAYARDKETKNRADCFLLDFFGLSVTV